MGSYLFGNDEAVGYCSTDPDASSGLYSRKRRFIYPFLTNIWSLRDLDCQKPTPSDSERKTFPLRNLKINSWKWAFFWIYKIALATRTCSRCWTPELVSKIPQLVIVDVYFTLDCQKGIKVTRLPNILWIHYRFLFGCITGVRVAGWFFVPHLDLCSAWIGVGFLLKYLRLILAQLYF